MHVHTVYMAVTGGCAYKCEFGCIFLKKINIIHIPASDLSARPFALIAHAMSRHEHTVAVRLIILPEPLHIDG